MNAVLNYKLTPALSTEVCLTSSVSVKNCIGIYHQWANNNIFMDVWYQRKKCEKKNGVFLVKQIIVTRSLCSYCTIVNTMHFIKEKRHIN